MGLLSTRYKIIVFFYGVCRNNQQRLPATVFLWKEVDRKGIKTNEYYWCQ